MKSIALIIIYLNSITARRIPIETSYDENQLAATEVQENKDELSGTGHTTNSKKHYQDVYVAQNNPKELEFGHVCEDPNEWEQRFEKINLGNLNRQGKIRWGDKNGGYVEHYYDFNHADQGNQQKKDDVRANNPESRIIATQHEPKAYQRKKRNPDEDVEFINDEAKSKILNEQTPKHGGNYRRAKTIRSKRQRIKDNDYNRKNYENNAENPENSNENEETYSEDY